MYDKFKISSDQIGKALSPYFAMVLVTSRPLQICFCLKRNPERLYLLYV